MTTSPTIPGVRQAVADALGTIDGLRVSLYVTDKVTTPQATVYRKEWAYDDAQHGPTEFGAHTYVFGIKVYAARANEKAAQQLLDDYAEPVGDTSVKQAVETDDDLSSLCDWALVTRVGEVLVETVGTLDYLTETFTVEVGVS